MHHGPVVTSHGLIVQKPHELVTLSQITGLFILKDGVLWHLYGGWFTAAARCPVLGVAQGEFADKMSMQSFCRKVSIIYRRSTNSQPKHLVFKATRMSQPTPPL